MIGDGPGIGIGGLRVNLPAERKGYVVTVGLMRRIRCEDLTGQWVQVAIGTGTG